MPACVPPTNADLRCQGDYSDFSCRCEEWDSTHTYYPTVQEQYRREIPTPYGVVVTGVCDPETDEWNFTLHYENDNGTPGTVPNVNFDNIACYADNGALGGNDNAED